MSEHNDAERTEEATPKRRLDAKEKGQVPRSREAGSSALLVVTAIWCMASGPALMGDLHALMHDGLSNLDNAMLDTASMYEVTIGTVLRALFLLLPFLLLALLTALATPLLTGGWSFYPGALAPDINRLNPLTGLGRVFSMKGLLELVKSLCKFLLITIVTLTVIWLGLPDLLQLDRLPGMSGISQAGDILVSAFIWTSVATLLLVTIDVPFVLWDHSRKLRMTMQELRDEHRTTEGKPEVKGRVRRLRQEYARARMITRVPEADVVITNPEHYATALRYQREKDAAPVVIAKGTDHVAAMIRQRARESNVPVVEIPALARAIYHSTKLDQPIPAGLFVTVARVLAYVYQLKNVSHIRPIYPPTEADIEIPPELRV